MNILQDQKLKNGFIVNDDDIQFVKLTSSMRLSDNIIPSQPKGNNNNPFKLFINKKDIESNYNDIYTEPIQNIKIKELDPETYYNDEYVKPYENYKRVNMQFQNRLNERIENNFNSSYVPQILTKNDVKALTSTRPKLQKELDGIEEYAKSHFLTEAQTNKLKEELIIKNYNEWKNKVDGVKENRGFENQPLRRGGPNNQPPDGGQGEQKEGEEPRRRQPIQDEGDELISATEGPTRPPNPDISDDFEEDKRNFNNDYINGFPKVNLALNPTIIDYNNIATSYYDNEFENTLFMSRLSYIVVDKFLQLFVKNDSKGIEILNNRFSKYKGYKLGDPDHKKPPNYIANVFRTINKYYKERTNGKGMILTDVEGIPLIPTSPLQMRKLISSMIEVLSRVRNLIEPNMNKYALEIKTIDEYKYIQIINMDLYLEKKKILIKNQKKIQK